MLLLQHRMSKYFLIKRFLLVVGIFYTAWFSFGSIRGRLSVEELSLPKPSYNSKTIPNGVGGAGSESAANTTTEERPQATTSGVAIQRVENATLLALAPKYHKAFLDPTDESFRRLECPSPKTDKYGYMQSRSRSLNQRKFFFAINLHDNIAILPRLIGSVIEAIQFLGASQCALSIIEGRSNDGTYEILNSLTRVLGSMGVQYYFSSSPENPQAAGGDRIAALAALRNQALVPLIKNQNDYSHEATIIFLNDVAICMEDILELIHQRINLGADMTCGMDWKNLWVDPTFYDVWIARGMNGDSFFQVGEDGNWDSAWNLFWNDAESKQKFAQHRPFQVFSCWNGGSAFTAKPFLEKKIAFRGPREGECYQGEPSIFCKEMWYHGFGKIAVVPTVNLEYSDDGARKVRELRGTASDFPYEGGDSTIRFDWISEPPDLVRCITNYDHQTWRPWNESIEIMSPTPS